MAITYSYRGTEFTRWDLQARAVENEYGAERVTLHRQAILDNVANTLSWDDNARPSFPGGRRTSHLRDLLTIDALADGSPPTKGDDPLFEEGASPVVRFFMRLGYFVLVDVLWDPVIFVIAFVKNLADIIAHSIGWMIYGSGEEERKQVQWPLARDMSPSRQGLRATEGFRPVALPPPTSAHGVQLARR